MLTPSASHSLTFHDVVGSLSTQKHKILQTTLLLWIAAGALIYAVPRSYKAQATVVPAETTGIAASSLLSPFPLSAQAIFDPKPSGNFSVYLAALRTREVARALLEHTELPHTLSHDREKSPFLRAIFGLRLKNSPINEDTIIAWLERNTSVTAHPSATIWIIEVRHQNPTLALDILTLIHKTAERRVREEMENMVARRLSWLTERVAAEPDTAIRSTLYDLIGQAQKHAAILASDTALAARLVSAPAVETEPSLPNRPFLIAISLLSSGLISAATWTLISITRQNKPPHIQARAGASVRREVFCGD